MQSLKSMVDQLKKSSSKRSLDEQDDAMRSKKYMTHKEIHTQQQCTPSPQEPSVPQKEKEPITLRSPLDAELSKEEVIGRLRSCNEPIQLFGESHTQRILRLRHAESKILDMTGQRNEYAKQLARTEAGLLRTQYEITPTSTKKPATPQYDLHLLSSALLATDPDMCFILVYKCLKSSLDTWDAELHSRPDAIKQSVQGKHDYAKYMSTKLNLKPFFKLLKRKSVANDVMGKIADILMFVQQREYVKANDIYLQLSIGNAPWPIGVTMVGIHERSGREKIFSNQIAHVLNDETQRKWIQAVKRIMTFAQTKFPPDDPAKMVG